MTKAFDPQPFSQQSSAYKVTLTMTAPVFNVTEKVFACSGDDTEIPQSLTYSYFYNNFTLHILTFSVSVG